MKESTTALTKRSAASVQGSPRKIALKGCPPGGGHKLYPWAPAGMRSHLGNPMKESILGLSVLSALSIAGIHSAVNPSYFTLRSFAAQPQAKAAAKEGLWIGLALGVAGSAGVGLVFDEWTPALVSALVALGLFGVGMYAISQPPIPTMPPINQQTQEISNP
jgi:hypothetical protein